MKKNMILFIGILFFLFTAVCEGKNLFIMGWDGAGYKNIGPMMYKNELPNLKAIKDSEGGCYTYIESISYTVTIPNWTEMSTGLTYDQTKVFDNNMWKPVPYDWTVPKALKDIGIKIGWFTSKPYLDNNSEHNPLAGIGINADSYASLPEENPDYIQVLAEKTIQFIDENPDGYFVFLHVNPDYYGHLYGENSKEYLGEIKRADYWLGEILKHINKENTKIVVISDHGFDEGKKSHHDAPDNFMVTDLPIKLFYCKKQTSGTMRDIANTILDYYGIDWKVRIPTMRGKSLLQP